MYRNKQKKVVSFRIDPEIYFRVGVRHADRKIYDKALKFLSIAAGKEPFNADYQFNLAGVLAELKQTEESNKILIGILRNIDPTLTECYFGIGCNYFDMDNISKAKEYFEKYLYFDPDGPFSDEVYDVLYYLQIYDNVGMDTKKSKLVTRLANQGRNLLDRGQYDKACSKFEKAIEIDPETIFIRNDLSLACFISGDVDRAISLANSALKLDPNDVFAHCNLAIFYNYEKRLEAYKKEITALSKLELTDKEEVSRLLDTCIRLGEHQMIKHILKNYIGDFQDAKEVLEASLRDNKIGGDVREEISGAILMYGKRIQDRQPRPGHIENVVRLKGRTDRWNKDWEAVIDCALQKKEFAYEASYKKELKSIWLDFINKAYPQSMPVIKKREVWAAALEYMYCKIHLINVSKRKLADKYKVSPSAITSRLKQFSK